MPPPIDRSRLLLVGALAAFALCYGQVIASIVGTWSTNPLYSYGFAVPLISGYVLWTRADHLKAFQRRPEYVVGAIALLSGTGLLVLGHLAASEALEQISLLVSLCGGVLFLGGREAFRLTWFPIAYMLLSIPIWERLIGSLMGPSQRLSGRIAALMLRMCGIPAAHDGTFVMLPNLTLEVLPECSGVNQLISVIAMALPAGYLWLQRSWSRGVLLGIAVVAAYLSNSFRIAMVGFLGYMGWGSGHLGVLHLFEGLVVALFGYLLVFACLSLLARVERALGAKTTTAPEGPVATPPVRLIPAFDVAFLAILFLAGAFRLTFYPDAVGLDADLRAFPMEIDEWAIDRAASSRPAFQLAGADDELVRVYRNARGESVTLYIAYQRTQAEGKEVTDIGGRTRRLPTAPVGLGADGRGITLNQVVHRQANRQLGTLFWYDLNGRIVTSRYLAKGYVILDTLLRRRSNGAVVMIDWESRPGADFDASRDRAMAFVRALLPILPRYLPS